MSLIALGCDPGAKWTVDSDGKIAGDDPTVAVAAGTLAYSPNGGLYVCIQADGAVGQYQACQIYGNWQAAAITTTNGTEAVKICIPQVALANNEYGWGLVWGNGQLEVGANCAANAQLYTTGNGGRLDDGATAIHISGAQLTAARGGGNGPALVAVQWPAVDLVV